MSNGTVYGIDLGTTYSCIAAVDEHSGKPGVLPNAEGEFTTPSVVLFEDAETRVVGREAKNTAMLEAGRVVEMVKRYMGSADWRRSFYDRDYTPEEISSYILRKVVDDAVSTSEGAATQVVITCPAYFGIAQREATATAGQLAGLDVLEIINEPTAAAIAYGLHDNRDQVVLVYDLGGGTFDVTVIEVKEGAVTVVATDGDHELGGRNWDERVVMYLAEEWKREHRTEDDPLDSPETLQDLWRRAEDAKRALTARPQTKVPVSHDGRQAAVPLTREKFDELTRDLLENTVTFSKNVLETARELGHPTVDRVLLVGGSTKMPQVATRLGQEFTDLEIIGFEPEQAVAKGAALYGQKLAIGERIRTEIAKQLEIAPEEVDGAEVDSEVKERAQQTVADDLGLLLPAVKQIDELQVTNVASHSFGVVAFRADDPDKQIISNQVKAQQRLPATQTHIYGTVTPDQQSVELRILENKERLDQVDDLAQGEEVGTAVLELAANLPKGSPIEVTFELNQQGRLVITGRDMSAGGKTVTTTIETNRTLSGDELEQAMEHARGIRVMG